MKVSFFIILLFFLQFLVAQEKQKDTLFFHYDKKYIKTYNEMPQQLYLYDSSEGSRGSFFFKEVEIKQNLNPKKISCLKIFVRSSEYYKNKKLDNYKLASFLNTYIVFLTKKENGKIQYIQLESSFEIE